MRMVEVHIPEPETTVLNSGGQTYVNHATDSDTRFCNINLRSICNKFPTFKQFVLDNNFFAVGVTETWLRPEDPDYPYTIPGYKLVRRDRVGRAGGVALYVVDSVKCISLEVITDADSLVEYLLIKTVINRVTIGLAVVYRPDDLALANLNILSDIISCFHCNDIEHFVILGDLNVNLLRTYPSSKFLKELLVQHECVQLVEHPTRVTDNCESLLDIVITSLYNAVSVVQVLPLCFSDHNVVTCSIDIKCEKPAQLTKVVRSFKHFYHDAFLDDASLYSWDLIYSLDSLEEKVDHFNYGLISLFDKHAPLKTVKVNTNKPYNPWFTDTLKTLKTLVRRAWSKYTSSGIDSDRRYYCDLRNYYNAAVVREKRAYFSSKINSCSRDSRCLWRQLRGWNVGAGRDVTDSLPSHLQDPNLINDYFIESIPVSGIGPGVDNPVSPVSIEHTLDFTLPDLEEVRSHILNLKPNVKGFDGISGKMLQLAIPFIVEPLTHIINVSFERGSIPYQWKLSLTYPRVKGGSRSKNKDDLAPVDLRPITILPVCLKVAEKVLYSQLVKFVDDNDILPHIQSGFRKGYSTTSALCAVLDDAAASVDAGLLTSLTLLDLSKAFDTVNFSCLLTKLHRYGVRGAMLDWFGSYLNNRTQFTVINTTMGPVWSEGRPIASGVPQGSILGPLLFSLYIADIHCTVQHCSLQLFADDIQLYLSFPIQDIHSAADKINTDLTKITDWARSNYLVLNPSKCQHILLGSKYSLRNVGAMSLFVDNTVIPNSDSVIDLGLVIDNELTFTKNISQLCKKAYYSWKQLLPFRDVLDASTKLLLVESLVLSLLNYGDIVYGPFISNADNYRLQKIQNLCIRFVTRIPPFTHVTPYIRDFKCLRMQERRFLHYAVFIHKILNSKCPPYLYNKLSKRSGAHERRLRHVDSTLSVPAHSTAFFEHGFSYLSSYVYNRLLCKIEHLSPVALKKHIKENLLIEGLAVINLHMF